MRGAALMRRGERVGRGSHAVSIAESERPRGAPRFEWRAADGRTVTIENGTVADLAAVQRRALTAAGWRCCG